MGRVAAAAAAEMAGSLRAGGRVRATRRGQPAVRPAALRASIGDADEVVRGARLAQSTGGLLDGLRGDPDSTGKTALRFSAGAPAGPAFQMDAGVPAPAFVSRLGAGEP